MKHLSSFTNLTELNLMSCGIGEKGLVCLSEMRLPKLQDLEIGKNGYMKGKINSKEKG